jgi:hypothetical protein
MEEEKKKKLHAVITGDARAYNMFKFLKKPLSAETYLDDDFPDIEKEINQLSGVN